MRMDARIYVAGHTGLLGRAICSMLKARGYKNVITRTRTELDLQNNDRVREFFEAMKPEYVFLCAGKVGGIVANRDYPADFIYQNLIIQTNVMHWAALCGVEKLIFFGSSCMYPKICSQPMKEEFIMTGEVEPTSKAYAIAKISGMTMCESYNKQYGTIFITAIPNTIYGPYDNFNPEAAHVLPSLITKLQKAKLENAKEVTLWGSGNPRREFIYVDDLADACLFLFERDIPFKILNIGSGVDISVRELAEKINYIVDYKGTMIWETSKPDGAPQKLLDSSHIKELGWKSSISLDEGIARTYIWYKSIN